MVDYAHFDEEPGSEAHLLPGETDETPASETLVLASDPGADDALSPEGLGEDVAPDPDQGETQPIPSWTDTTVNRTRRPTPSDPLRQPPGRDDLRRGRQLPWARLRGERFGGSDRADPGVVSAVVGRLALDDFHAPEIDLAAAWRSIYALPHKFMIAVVPIDHQKGGLYLDDESARRERLTVGVVIAAGAATDLQVGDHAVVVAKFAKVVRGLRVGDFEYRLAPDQEGYVRDGEIWMFGLTSPHVRECRLVEARHTVVAVVGHTEFDREPVNFPKSAPRDAQYAVHDGSPGQGRVLIRLDSKSAIWANSHGGPDLHLPDRLADRADEGTIIASSRSCVHVAPGDRVLYLRRGLESMYPDGQDDLAFAPEKAIYAVVKS